MVHTYRRIARCSKSSILAIYTGSKNDRRRPGSWLCTHRVGRRALSQFAWLTTTSDYAAWCGHGLHTNAARSTTHATLTQITHACHPVHPPLKCPKASFVFQTRDNYWWVCFAYSAAANNEGPWILQPTPEEASRVTPLPGLFGLSSENASEV